MTSGGYIATACSIWPSLNTDRRIPARPRYEGGCAAPRPGRPVGLSSRRPHSPAGPVGERGAALSPSSRRRIPGCGASTRCSSMPPRSRSTRSASARANGGWPRLTSSGTTWCTGSETLYPRALPGLPSVLRALEKFTLSKHLRLEADVRSSASPHSSPQRCPPQFDSLGHERDLLLTDAVPAGRLTPSGQHVADPDHAFPSLFRL